MNSAEMENFFLPGIILTDARWLQTLLTRCSKVGYRVTVMLRRTAIRSESGGCVLNKLENT